MGFYWEKGGRGANLRDTISKAFPGKFGQLRDPPESLPERKSAMQSNRVILGKRGSYVRSTQEKNDGNERKREEGEKRGGDGEGGGRLFWGVDFLGSVSGPIFRGIKKGGRFFRG